MKFPLLEGLIDVVKFIADQLFVKTKVCENNGWVSTC